MGVKRDFSDVNRFFERAKKEVMSEMDRVGRKAVSYAKATGDYEDHTGNLRASNAYEVTEEGLKIMNTADYAAYVESKGYTVCSEAALFAEQQLKKTFEG